EVKRIYVSCNSGFIAVIRQIDADHYESVANIATVKGAQNIVLRSALEAALCGRAAPGRERGAGSLGVSTAAMKVRFSTLRPLRKCIKHFNRHEAYPASVVRS